MSDKPGMTRSPSSPRSSACRRKRAASFRSTTPSISRPAQRSKAGELVDAGRHRRGGQHRRGSARTLVAQQQARPDWFSTRQQYGGILSDIVATGSSSSCSLRAPIDAEVVSASVASRGNPRASGPAGRGRHRASASPRATGYVRVDWFTPEGPRRLGRRAPHHPGDRGLYRAPQIHRRRWASPASDHLFLVDQKGTQHARLFGVGLPYGRQLIADVLNRTETAMPQARALQGNGTRTDGAADG